MKQFSKEEFDKLLEKMINYNVFQYAIALKGERGYEYSDEFRAHLLRSIKIAKSHNYKGRQLELFISSIMTFNEKISFQLATEMGYVLGGRDLEAQKLIMSRSKLK